MATKFHLRIPFGFNTLPLAQENFDLRTLFGHPDELSFRVRQISEHYFEVSILSTKDGNPPEKFKESVAGELRSIHQLKGGKKLELISSMDNVLTVAIWQEEAVPVTVTSPTYKGA